MKCHSLGMTLVELMASIAVASILSLAVVSTFSANSTVIMAHNLKSKSNEEGKEAFDMMTRLLRQAKQSSITVSSTPNKVTLDFSLPQGYPIWPNNVSPYTDNAVRIQWENHTSKSNPNALQIGKASSISGLNSAILETLVGHSANMETSIADFQVEKLANGKYYQITLASQVKMGGKLSPSQSIFKAYVLPRN